MNLPLQDKGQKGIKGQLQLKRRVSEGLRAVG